MRSITIYFVTERYLIDTFVLNILNVTRYLEVSTTNI